MESSQEQLAEYPPSRPESVTPFPSIVDQESAPHEKGSFGLHHLDPASVDANEGPPPLNYTLHTRGRERSIFIWFSLIFCEACVLPLILFYSLRWGAHLSITKNLAIITSLIGTVSGLKVTQRAYYLWFRNGHESRRPIGAGRWGVDFFHILISLALTAFFTPLIIGSSLTPASVPAVSMAIPFFMLTVCIPMTISGLFPGKFRLPFRVSSFPPHHPLPPLTYTIVEDVVAVDGGGRLEFRHAWRRRYEESRVMRSLLRDVALFWGLTGVVIAGALIALAWTVSEDIGYGLSYGLPWLWVVVCTLITIWWVRKELVMESREWADKVHVHREKALNLVETQLDRDVYAMVLSRKRTLSRARSEIIPSGARNLNVTGSVDGQGLSPPIADSPQELRRGRCTSV